MAETKEEIIQLVLARDQACVEAFRQGPDGLDVLMEFYSMDTNMQGSTGPCRGRDNVREAFVGIFGFVDYANEVMETLETEYIDERHVALNNYGRVPLATQPEDAEEHVEFKWWAYEIWRLEDDGVWRMWRDICSTDTRT